MSSSNKRNTGFLVQGSILAVASVVSRLIGLLYRAPLTDIIGDLGNNYYSTAYEIYTLMLFLSSLSLPLAVSKMVSARIALGEYKNAHRVFKASVGFAFVSGLVFCALMYLFADVFSDILKTPLAELALKVLAPTVLIVALLGTIRGFFQGVGTMMPSAVSQIVEQVLNAIASVVAAYFMFSYGERVGAVLGDTESYACAYGAAGGTFGTGFGALVGLLFVLFIYAIYKPSWKRKVKRDKTGTAESYSTIIKVLLLTVLPVLLSTTLYNIIAIIDQGIFKNLSLYLGYASRDIDIMWGIYAGKYRVLVNVPIALASALVSASVPAVTRSYVSRNYIELRQKVSGAIRFTMIITFPCTVGLFVLASPALQLLFKDATAFSASLLQWGIISVVFYSLSTLTNGILQGINRMKVPVINSTIALVIQAVVLVATMFALDKNIYAVVLANCLFAFIMVILNGRAVVKYVPGYKQEIILTFVKPLIASLLMGVAVFGVYKGLMLVLRINAICTLVSIAVGAVCYMVILILIKGVDEDDMLGFPGGRTMLTYARKFRLM